MKRPKLTGVNHYNVFPFNHGGSLAIRGLYKGLSEWFDVNIITFTLRDRFPDEVYISKHIKVIPIVLPDSLAKAQLDMYAAYGMTSSATADSAPVVARLYHKYPEIVERVREIAADSVAILAEHTYTWRIIKEACPDKPLWYRAHNVEYDYKKTTWDAIGCPADLLRETFEIEKECVEGCERVLTISEEEAKRFIELYELPESARGKILNINAGYDTDNLQTVLPSARKKLATQYDYTGLFIASDTPHTRRAADACIAAAEKLPNVQMLIAGRVGKAYMDQNLPENVIVTGVITDDEKEDFLKRCDFALNPLDGGAGVNVKMFEYFAYGLPVITTPHGARGIDVISGRDAIIGDSAQLAESIRSFCAFPMTKKDEIAKNALHLLLEKYSWRGIGRLIAECIAREYGINVSDGVLPLSETALYDFTPNETPYLPERPFYIRGAGEFGVKCLRLLRGYGLEPIAFIDDNKAKKFKSIENVPVMSVEKFSSERKDCELIVAIGEYWPEAAAEHVCQGIPLERISLSWSGKYILSMANLAGNCPPYFVREKYKTAIVCECEKNQKRH